MKPSEFLKEEFGKEKIQSRFKKLSGGETLSDREKYWAGEVEKLKKELEKYKKHDKKDALSEMPDTSGPVGTQPGGWRRTDMEEDTAYAGGMGQGGYAGQSYRKYKAKPAGLNEDSIDVIKLDVPLFIRLLEYAREDAQTDMDLHDVTTRVIELAAEGKILNMSNYDDLMKPIKKESSIMKGLQN